MDHWIVLAVYGNIVWQGIYAISYLLLPPEEGEPEIAQPPETDLSSSFPTQNIRSTTVVIWRPIKIVEIKRCTGGLIENELRVKKSINRIIVLKFKFYISAQNNGALSLRI